MSERENPAVVFMAHTLARNVHGEWATLPDDTRQTWLQRSSELLSAMYEAGFTIPQPENPDAIWDALHAESARGPSATADHPVLTGKLTGAVVDAHISALLVRCEAAAPLVANGGMFIGCAREKDHDGPHKVEIVWSR